MSTPTTLTIHTDHGPLTLPAGSRLADAVAVLLSRSHPATTDATTDAAADATSAAASAAVATAVNGQFVARHARATHVLHDGDTVLCFSPITGG